MHKQKHRMQTKTCNACLLLTIFPSQTWVAPRAHDSLDINLLVPLSEYRQKALDKLPVNTTP